MLLCAVGIQEFAREVDDLLAVERHDKARICLHLGHNGGLKVFFIRKGGKACGILLGYDNGHTLLRFTDGKLCAVKTLVFFGNHVEVDAKAVGKLTDGNRHAAGTKVVTTLDEAGSLLAAEQTLELALLGRVTLLHLGTAGFQRIHLVGLGGAGSTATAVTSRATAEQDDHVTRCGALTAYVLGRCGRDHGTDLHALGGIAVVVKLVYLTRCKTDLVAVGGIACGRRGDDLLLRKLAGHGFRERAERICRARHTHGGVHVRASGKRIADRTADTGGGTAKRLDLGGMVMRFIFEEEKPFFGLSVYIHVHFDGAGVDLLGFVELRKLAVCLQITGSDRGKIHEIDGLCAADGTAGRQILLIGFFEKRILKMHVVDRRQEGGMAAVIRPIGVDHADLGNGGVALLLCEIIAAEAEVVHIHGKALIRQKSGKACIVQLCKAGKRFNTRGLFIARHERCGLFKHRLTALHAVDNVFLHTLDVGIGQVAKEEVYTCGTHGRTLALRDDLDALRGGIGTLVILTRQIFHSKDMTCGKIRLLGGSDIQLGLGEHRADGVIKQLLIDIFHVVAVEKAEACQLLNAEKATKIGKEGICLMGESVFLFYIYTIYHQLFSPARIARAPISRR